jgi:hypothetical protein
MRRGTLATAFSMRRPLQYRQVTKTSFAQSAHCALDFIVLRWPLNRVIAIRRTPTQRTRECNPHVSFKDPEICALVIGLLCQSRPATERISELAAPGDRDSGPCMNASWLAARRRAMPAWRDRTKWHLIGPSTAMLWPVT